MASPFRAAVLAAAALLGAAAGRADCDAWSTFRAPFRSSALDVFAAADVLWVADAWGVVTYDPAGETLSPISSLALPGMTTRVRADGDIAWAASGGSIHVVRLEQRIEHVREVSLGSLIHDLLYEPPYLYAATDDGIVQLDATIRESPTPRVVLPTTSGAAYSLAKLDATLYAADGDATLEAYTLQVPEFPQKIGTVATIPRPTSVRVTASRRILVSDGQQTDLFSGGGASLVRHQRLFGIGASAVAPLSGDVSFLVGSDRKIRAIDFSALEGLAILFESEVLPTAGTLNRVSGLSSGHGRLFVAAGDAGLLAFDLSQFSAPFPVRTHLTEPPASVADLGTKVVTSRAAGGLARYNVTANGGLTLESVWDGSRGSVIHETLGRTLITSSGRALVVWDAAPATPVATGTTTFVSSIRSVAVAGNAAYVVLEDQTLWRTTLPAGQPERLPLDGQPLYVAAAGSDLVVADFVSGTTRLRHYSGANTSLVPTTVSLEGAATSGITAAGNRVAAATFRGVSIVTFGTAARVDLLPGTSRIVRDLYLAGEELFVLYDAELEIWNVASLSQLSRTKLPAGQTALHVANTTRAVIAATRGITTFNRMTASRLPDVVESLNSNLYHRKVVSSRTRFYLSDGQRIDAFSISDQGVPSFDGSFFVSGLVDVTSMNGDLFALTSSARILRYDAGGVLIAEMQLTDMADRIPRALHAAGEVVYAAVTSGCSTGDCQQTTYIIDPRDGGATVAGTLQGLVSDVSAAGARTAALFTLPDEIRLYDSTNPAAPRLLAARASEGSPVSLALSPNGATIYTLGSRLYAYAATNMAKVSEQLSPYVADQNGRVGYPDQRVRWFGSCALIGGRMFDPLLYSVASPSVWSLEKIVRSPSAVRSISSDGAWLYLLSEHGLEILSTGQPPPPPRLRAARRE